jgi:hypothetical protein
MFTNHNLQPGRVAGNILTVIEQHEMCGVPLSDAVRQRGDMSSPIWILENGEGTFIHGNLAPCSKHPRAFKSSQKCTSINRDKDGRYVVEVVGCKAPRCI